MEVKPIFVLGSARNGTSYLSNILSNHPEIVAAKHPLHYGVKESKLFINNYVIGDFKSQEDYYEFLDIYADGDYFNLCNANKNRLMDEIPKNFFEFFLKMMDNFALRHNVKFWLAEIKASSFLSIEDSNFIDFLVLLEDRYRDYKFISIKRDIEKAIKSYINKDEHKERFFNRNFSFLKRILAILKRSFVYLRDYKQIKEIIEKTNGLSIKFEDIKNCNIKAFEKISEYLGVDLCPDMLNEFSYETPESENNIPDCFLNLGSLIETIDNYAPFLTENVINLGQKRKNNSFKNINIKQRLKNLVI